MKKASILLALALISSNVPAQTTPVVVNSDQCTEVKGTPAPFILSLHPGESLIDMILKCANDAQLSGASVSGVGTVKNPHLHYYDAKLKQNIYRSFIGSYELVSLVGNIAIQDGKRVAHLHAGLGNQHYQMIGGHLESAQVTALAEITIIPLTGSVLKVKDPNTGFDVLSTGS